MSFGNSEAVRISVKDGGTVDRYRRGPIHGLQIAGVFAFLLIVAAAATAQAPALTETQIKAGFLFNFTKFVEWPADSFSSASSPIILGIMGEDEFGELLDRAAAGKIINGRVVMVKRFKEEGTLQACNILFISASEEKHLARIVQKLKGTTVLTVGEAVGFAQLGGIINFSTEGNRVRLEINLEAAARARLKISAKVIAVARLVTDTPTTGESTNAKF